MIDRDDILSDRYLLKEQLGAGGMGTVYRAIDLRTGAQVAIKVPHPALLRDHVYMQRLRREAQMAASLQSSRVARVTDFAEHRGTPYLVMEYVPGETLADRLDRGGPMPVEEALHVAIEVARALDAASQRGICHRDLKPQNIRLDGADVKVLDFGIARLDGEQGLTGAGVLVGSPEYLAPERVEESGDIRSDIYSLGIVLYEMLTGRVPFGGDTPWTVLRRHAAEPPPPLPPGLPAVVYPLVECCLAKRPADRFQGPQELVAALRDALRAVGQQETLGMALPLPPSAPLAANLIEPAPSRDTPAPVFTPAPAPAPAPASTVPAGRRRGRPWLYAGAGAAAIAVAVIVRLLLSRGDGTAVQQAAARPPAVVPQSETTAPPGPAEGAAALSVVFPTGGEQVASPVRLEVKAEGVTLKAPAEQDPSARHLHYFLDTDPAAVLGPGQPVPTGSQNIIHAAATSRILDLPPGPHTVWVVMTDNDHIPLSPGVQASVSFVVSGTPARTGEQAPLVYQSLVGTKWQIFTMDGTGRNVRRLSAGNVDDIEPAWAADGSKIAFVSRRDGRQHLYVMSADGSGVQQLTRGDFDDRAPAWSADGTLIAFVSNRDGGRDQVFVMESGGGQPRQLTRGAGGGSEPAWSPDGKQIAFVREQGSVTHIYVVDAAGGEPKQITTANQRHIDPAWSPDGRRIAFSSFRDNRWNVFVMNANGSNVQKLTGGDPQDRHPAWSPDGRQIVFASGREGQLQLYTLPLEGGQVRTLTEGLAHNLHPSWPRR